MTTKKKRKAGRNKTAAKKRAYKAHCYSMRLAGYVTDANGQWVDGKSQRLGISEANVRGTTGR